MTIGIDIGSTTTKAVAILNNQILKKIKTKAFDAVTSATGALGKLVTENGIKISDIKKIIITGAGASKIHNNLFGIETGKIDEITAIGIGGMFLSQKENIIIANIGTGTALLEAKKDKITHIGGTGVGGGTITGLSKKLLLVTDFNAIMELAQKGNLKQVDLLIGDIAATNISFLNTEATASNFGKVLDTAGREDIAIGIINLVYQVIGTLSVFAARSKNLDTIIITGNGSNNIIGKKILTTISEIYKLRFEYPVDAEYTTAIGAGLSEDY
jgi:type II pantothenate kinase